MLGFASFFCFKVKGTINIPIDGNTKPLTQPLLDISELMWEPPEACTFLDTKVRKIKVKVTFRTQSHWNGGFLGFAVHRITS